MIVIWIYFIVTWKYGFEFDIEMNLGIIVTLYDSDIWYGSNLVSNDLDCVNNDLDMRMITICLIVTLSQYHSDLDNDLDPYVPLISWYVTMISMYNSDLKKLHDNNIGGNNFDYDSDPVA